MTNKFLSVLSAVGKDFKKGLDVVLKVGQVAVPFVSAANPLAGTLLSTTIGVVLQTEQKFAAMGKQNGTGVDKLSEATAILGPLLSQALGDINNPASTATVQKYINSVVAVLNTTPTSGGLPMLASVAAKVNAAQVQPWPARK